MYGMTTACLYRSHRLYDHSCHVRNPYGSTVPCIPPAQVHSHSRVNPSNYHIHTRPHTHTTPRRTTPPRIVAETPKPGRIVEMSPGLLACSGQACEEARGLLDELDDRSRCPPASSHARVKHARRPGDVSTMRPVFGFSAMIRGGVGLLG